MLLLALALGCTKTDDTGERCQVSGEPELVIGQGLAGSFDPFDAGQVVGLTSAPQGGFGVGIRAQVSGLVTSEGEVENAPMPVLMETYIEGELSDSFENQGATVYCQEDGSGLIWDLVVGFDRETYRSVDDLVQLQGVMATLRILATDLDGTTAEGEIEIQIEVD